MKKNKLSLDKFRIAKLKNPASITGGTMTGTDSSDCDTNTNPVTTGTGGNTGSGNSSQCDTSGTQGTTLPTGGVPTLTTGGGGVPSNDTKCPDQPGGGG